MATEILATKQNITTVIREIVSTIERLNDLNYISYCGHAPSISDTIRLLAAHLLYVTCENEAAFAMKPTHRDIEALIGAARRIRHEREGGEG